jgi:hypothetical protein
MEKERPSLDSFDSPLLLEQEKFADKYTGLSNIINLGRFNTYLQSVLNGAVFSSQDVRDILNSKEQLYFDKVNNSGDLDDLYSKGMDLTIEIDLLRFNFYSLIIEMDRMKKESQARTIFQLKTLLPQEIIKARDAQITDYERYLVEGLPFNFFASAFAASFNWNRSYGSQPFSYMLNAEGNVLKLLSLFKNEAVSNEQLSYIIKDLPEKIPQETDERFRRYSYEEFVSLLENKNVKVYRCLDGEQCPEIGVFIEIL